MFEKDAEEKGVEYANKQKKTTSIHEDSGYSWGQVEEGYENGFKDGAEFGYKLAHEEMDYLNKHWGSEEESKANEWHYPSKGELPGESEEEIKENGEKVYAIFKNNSYYIIDRASVKNYEDLIAWTELPTFKRT